jgi:hypothetical protein
MLYRIALEEKEKGWTELSREELLVLVAQLEWQVPK